MSLPAIDDSPDLLDDGERLSMDELRTLQMTRLQDTVRNAYANVDHYRETFDNRAFTPTTSRRSTTC